MIYTTLDTSDSQGSFSSQPQPQGSMSDREVIHDDEYYLEQVTLQVENVLFRVPKHHFADSEGIFGTLFTLPQPTTVQGNGEAFPLEGSCPENPIKLPDTISLTDFRAFVRVLHPKTFPVNYDSFTIDEWISILHLSTQWDYTALRTFAIERLSSKLTSNSDPVTKLILGQKYNIRSWFKDGCMHLIGRWSGPTKEEGMRLGWGTTIKLYSIRERAARSRGVFDTAAAVESDFAEELDF